MVPLFYSKFSLKKWRETPCHDLLVLQIISDRNCEKQNNFDNFYDIFRKILKVFVSRTRSNAGKLIFQWIVERESDVCGGIN